jgi:predicted CoA-binding protein
MVKAKSIEDFLALDKYAVVGVSKNKRKFGYIVFENMKKKGYDVYPINPKEDEILECTCYPDIKSLPEKVDGIIIVTPPEVTDKIVKEALEAGIENIWIQPQAESKAIMEFAEKNSYNIICKQCMLMHSQPRGIHKLHKNINKLFGTLPK